MRRKRRRGRRGGGEEGEGNLVGGVAKTVKKGRTSKSKNKDKEGNNKDEENAAQHPLYRHDGEGGGV
jgi:hypothetical protein